MSFLDYKINTIQIWNDEETEQKEYTYIYFPMVRFTVYFDNVTGECDSIIKSPVIVQKQERYINLPLK